MKKLNSNPQSFNALCCCSSSVQKLDNSFLWC
ncbi:hypothetical protein J2Z35_000552 [Acetoanaerobium pronyense]|uniref:Uncharacterized protein n=1 Tax=Acetoanaerobium pronyense TaxID=1482736 RepID=A0ABS4KHZ2_9FIRM|nr:hypothetical protein [Acetoanaerobium pronyense]